jgi:formylglycine-generating enzyme required for sulfatase activity
MALPDPLQGEAVKGKKYALLVGVNTYKHEDLKPLKYTENDVEELAKLLGKPSAGFAGVRVLTATRGKNNPKDRPTAANIRAAIAELAKGLTGDDLVLVALSGHGVELSVPDPDNKRPNNEYHYFCPSDATLEGISYSTGEHAKLLHLKLDVFRKLGGCPGHKVVLIDACRNELEAKVTARSIDVGKDTEVHKNLAVLFSCGSRQRSWETGKLAKGHGVFFYHVLEGLKGKAPKNAKNEITWDFLIAHVKDQLSDDYMNKLIGGGAKQTPHGLGSLVGSLPLLTVDAEATPPDVPALVKGKAFANSIGMKFALVPAGEGTIGSPTGEAGRRDDEKPRAVKIAKAFYMGVHEVTQAEYEKVMGKNPSHFSAKGKGKEKVAGMPTGRFPVERVSFVEAKAFCDKLTAMAGERGRVYRLPTEEEWEYACRAGSKTATHHGNAVSSKQANFNGDPHGRTCPVGTYAPNAWGLFDMHGNVAEWTTTKDAKAASSRITRGGSWDQPGDELRSARREPLNETPGDNQTGFRVVCEMP